MKPFLGVDFALMCVCGHTRGKHNSTAYAPRIVCFGERGVLPRADCSCPDFADVETFSYDKIIADLQLIVEDLR